MLQSCCNTRSPITILVISNPPASGNLLWVSLQWSNRRCFHFFRVRPDCFPLSIQHLGSAVAQFALSSNNCKGLKSGSSETTPNRSLKLSTIFTVKVRILAFRETHCLGLSHGNLKISNILIDNDSNLKLSGYLVSALLTTLITAKDCELSVSKSQVCWVNCI